MKTGFGQSGPDYQVPSNIEGILKSLRKGLWQDRVGVLARLANAHKNLNLTEIQIVDSKPNPIHQAQPGTIHRFSNKRVNPLHAFQEVTIKKTQGIERLF